jgi:hypothetical protein
MEGESITGDVDAPVAAERHALLGAKVCVEAIAGGVGALTRYVLGRLKPYIANLCEMPKLLAVEKSRLIFPTKNF